MSLRLAIFAFDIPFPANRGGRADIWRRIVALKRNGVDIFLVCWIEPGAREPSASELETIRRHVAELRIYRTRKGLGEALKRIALLPWAPSHAASRRIGGVENEELLRSMKHFAPGAVWCEGPYPGFAARRFADLLGVPLYYRSHNIEHQYMEKQAHAAVGWRRRLALRFACMGLARFETRLIVGASRVFDISNDDLVFWQSRGLRRGEWLPPLAECALIDELPPAAVDADVVFLGNLTTPNNIRGVEWLVTEIAPNVLAQRPETRFLVAGSNANDYVRRICAAQPGVTLIENPPDALAIFRGARVLANPVRTGSGMHMKALDMLMMDAPIVSATQGTCGMPDEIRRLFHVSDNTAGFADALVAELTHPRIDPARKALAEKYFGLSGIAVLANRLSLNS